MPDPITTIRAILVGADGRIQAIEQKVDNQDADLNSIKADVEAIKADVAAIRQLTDAIQMAVLNVQQSLG